VTYITRFKPVSVFGLNNLLIVVVWLKEIEIGILLILSKFLKTEGVGEI